MNITFLSVALTLLPFFSLLLPLLSVVPRSLFHLSKVQLIVILTETVPGTRRFYLMAISGCYWIKSYIRMLVFHLMFLCILLLN